MRYFTLKVKFYFMDNYNLINALVKGQDDQEGPAVGEFFLFKLVLVLKSMNFHSKVNWPANIIPQQPIPTQPFLPLPSADQLLAFRK